MADRVMVSGRNSAFKGYLKLLPLTFFISGKNTFVLI